MYNHRFGPTPLRVRYERVVQAGAQVFAIKVVEETYPGAKDQIAVVKRVAAAHIKKVAKVVYPNTSDDEFPLEDFSIMDIPSQGLILVNEALKPNDKPHNMYHIMGLGNVENSLLAKVNGRQCHGSNSSGSAKDEALEKAKEEALRAKEEAQLEKKEAAKATEGRRSHPIEPTFDG